LLRGFICGGIPLDGAWLGYRKVHTQCYFPFSRSTQRHPPPKGRYPSRESLSFFGFRIRLSLYRPGHSQTSSLVKNKIELNLIGVDILQLWYFLSMFNPPETVR